MGIRYLESDCIDYDADDDKYDKFVVNTTGCGCCSKRLVVKMDNLPEICYHLQNSMDTVAVAQDLLRKLYGMTAETVYKLAVIFKEQRENERGKK